MDPRIEQLSQTELDAIETYYKIWSLPSWGIPNSRQMRVLREFVSKEWKEATPEEQEELSKLGSGLGPESLKEIENLFHIYHQNRAEIIDRKNREIFEKSRQKRLAEQQEQRNRKEAEEYELRRAREERQRQAALEMDRQREEMAKRRRAQFEAERAALAEFDADLAQRGAAQNQLEREREIERRRGFKRGVAVVIKQEPYSGLFGEISQIYSENAHVKIRVNFKLLGKPFSIVCNEKEVELNYRVKS